LATEPLGSQAAGDVPLFAEETVPTLGDVRSVGELLTDVDYRARQLLHEAEGADAAALVAAWPRVAASAERLWRALPGRETPASRAGGQERPVAGDDQMALIASAGVAISAEVAANPRWPGPRTAPDSRLVDLASTIDRAAGLVERYGGDILAHLDGPPRADVLAARARLMHGVYLSSHAVSRCLHDYGAEQNRANPKAAPLATTRSPNIVAPLGPWHDRFARIEDIARSYVAPRWPAALAGEVTARDHAPARIRQAVSAWNTAATRTAADISASPADLAFVARTQRLIAGHTSMIVGSLRADQIAPDLAPTVDRLAEHASQASGLWSQLGRRWSEIGTADPTAPRNPALDRAASEVRAAMRQLTHDDNEPRAADLIRHHPLYPQALAVALETAPTSREVASALRIQATRTDLAASPRVVHQRLLHDFPDDREHSATIAAQKQRAAAAIRAGGPMQIPTPMRDRLIRTAAATAEHTATLDRVAATTSPDELLGTAAPLPSEAQTALHASGHAAPRRGPNPTVTAQAAAQTPTAGQQARAVVRQHWHPRQSSAPNKGTAPRS